MATTTNFGWETPDDTDLVKDGALAIRTLGNSIDTSLVDLKGGTTGQVLSKTSNTDMDFTWVTTDDVNAIQNAIVDAKGDLIAASAADTPARLAVGNNGDTLVADSSASTGLRWQADFSVGRNKILNSDFGIWQRGTTFNSIATNTYTADRWSMNYDGGGTRNITRETFTPGTAPVAGYEGQYYLKWNQTVATTGGTFATLFQRIEDARTLAGQTVTVSFWAKTDSNRTTYAASGLTQNFGSGGSPSSAVSTNAASTFSFTTSWTRYSFTVNLPSVSGKTFGTNNDSYLQLTLRLFNDTTFTFEIWGVQVEAGSVASPFTTATGTLAGELQAAQRYYWRVTGPTLYAPFGQGYAYSTTAAAIGIQNPVPMRVTPTSIDAGNLWIQINNVAGYTYTGLAIDTSVSNQFFVYVNATGATGLTQYRPYSLTCNNNAAGYFGFSAEL